MIKDYENRTKKLTAKYKTDKIFRAYVDTILAEENRTPGTIEEVFEAVFISAVYRRKPDYWIKIRKEAIESAWRRKRPYQTKKQSN